MDKTFLVTNDDHASDFNPSSFHHTSQTPEAQHSFISYRSPLKLVYASSPLEKPYNLLLKRVADVFLSSLMIIFVLSWLIPLIAILIKLDSAGPVFFLQKRNKKNGGIFTCIKFRSMIVNPSADKASAIVNDKRITSFGKHLRRRHLDELPQLFNVLWGDMSLIGPRPHMLIENKRYEKLLTEYTCRHQVKPGITGLAQSFGYSGPVKDLQKIKERVDIDLIYINQWSAKMDIQILLRTFRMIAAGSITHL